MIPVIPFFILNFVVSVNCRCWAEPYRPEKTADKPIIVDVSGLDMFKELQKTLKPVDFDTSNLPRYAENDKVNTATDAVYVSNNAYAHRKVKFRSPEEEKLLKRIGKQIFRTSVCAKC